ncbi:MAG TPA: transcriptional regulator [Erysipelotrichaceae bacterium]|nr:transcriptional regulator [Erysipelotrichaceae bacterium]
MVFSGIPFLFVFLPVLLVVYRLVPATGKNAVLLLFSLLFYFYGEGSRILIMLVTITVNFLAGIGMERYPTKRRWMLGIALVYDLGQLVLFKYTDFLIDTLNHTTGTSISLLHIIMPLGISFFTFQTISYIVDVYQGKIRPSYRLIDFAMYVTLFPQLVAGPIVRFESIEHQIHHRTVSEDGFEKGITRFVTGLFKKTIVADTIASFVNVIGRNSIIGAWMSAIGFILQLYYDFSGYSDMAIGLGRMFGFTFPENFNYPLSAVSVTDFWRRWHITLSSFFKDYVYIPLGGNRVSILKWIRNIAVVWFLTGLWHGAGWNFIIWGLYFGVLLFLEKTVFAGRVGKHPYAGRTVTFLLVVIGFAIFSADSLQDGLHTLSCMAGLQGLPFLDMKTLFCLRDYGVVLIGACICAFPVLPALQKMKCMQKLSFLQPLIILAVLILVTAFLVDASFSPFLYFRF